MWLGKLGNACILWIFKNQLGITFTFAWGLARDNSETAPAGSACSIIKYNSNFSALHITDHPCVMLYNPYCWSSSSSFLGSKLSCDLLAFDS